MMAGAAWGLDLLPACGLTAPEAPDVPLPALDRPCELAVAFSWSLATRCLLGAASLSARPEEERSRARDGRPAGDVADSASNPAGGSVSSTDDPTNDDTSKS